MNSEGSHSPRMRRKSSFFRRELCSAIETTIVSQGSSSPEADNIILDHVREMEEEIAHWHTMYRKVKSKYQELEKFKNDINVVSWKECKDDLTKEDLEFLNAKPDYKNVKEQVEKLSQKIEIMKHKTYLTKVKVNLNINKASEALKDVKQNICEHLLNSDESEALFAVKFNDSGNYSMDDSIDTNV